MPDPSDHRTMAAAYSAMSNPAPLTLEQKLDDAMSRIARLEQSLDALTSNFEAEMTAEPHPLIIKFDEIMDALKRHNIVPREKQEALIPKPPALVAYRS